MLQLRHAVFVEGIFLGLVQLGAGDHVERGFLDPRQAAGGGGDKTALRIAKPATVEVAGGLQVSAQLAACGGLDLLRVTQAGAVPGTGAEHRYTSLGQQKALRFGHVGFNHLADKRRGAAFIIAAAAAAFAGQERVTRRLVAFTLNAQWREQLVEFAGCGGHVGFFVGGVGYRGEAVHRKRHRAEAFFQVGLAQCIGRQRCHLFIRQQQAQVDPAVIARAQEGQVAAAFKAVA
ncbi:hypothetical protein [Pseudomonas sp. 22 E 5]|nr:hypothetical protein [Pseudomonas sp. 22 E 5]